MQSILTTKRFNQPLRNLQLQIFRTKGFIRATKFLNNSFKVYGFTSKFSVIFTKRNNCDFLFASLDYVALPKWG